MSKLIIPIAVVLLAVFFIYRTWNNGKLAEMNQVKGAEFLSENSTKDGVVTTETGLQYQVLQKGTGEKHPTATSRVKVHYHGTLIDGTVFDSSVERNEPIAFGLNQVIKGWTEGVQLMVEGDKFRLFVPSDLGYGKGGTGPIPPASVLIFDVELLEIQ
ncbi:FKBP-type peptidyl-prolyl cis-trans isomerase [Vibrio genomosp. F10]|uniref:FKBP-type peptidyl-prolyl cis-trans isomerase n=1 Tax=Vibrio genomosp. F10 TaxID=723171 RepID=UPI0002FBE70E|nr:FKBP-type peptidyl-prolyl cis-trans isomerase [Vibrio genomosp. F10]OEF09837.1 peptidylprolyl isomerase [Vibrio genomosp. F10 str. 9ZB36]